MTGQYLWKIWKKMVNRREKGLGERGEGVIDRCRELTVKCPSAQQNNLFFLKIPLCGTAFATKLLVPVL